MSSESDTAPGQRREARPATLACPVRECGLPLQRAGRTWLCARGHSHDVARSGYVNLLQPQDRRSPQAGDTKEAVDARRRVLAAGAGQAVLDAMAARARALGIGSSALAVDLGCGAGDLLHAVCTATGAAGIGIDLSVPAIDRAARRVPALTWVVANADRRLPLVDGCASLVLSLNARRNPPECARILRPDGVLIAGVPAPDDLIELRSAVQGDHIQRDRLDAVIAAHDDFTLMERLRVVQTVALERDRLLDLLRGTYRGERRSLAANVAQLSSLSVTIATDVAVMQKRG